MTSPAAQRMRQLRERRARGVRVIAIEIDVDLLNALEQSGLLGQDEIDDPSALAFALSMLIEAGIEARRSHLNLF